MCGKFHICIKKCTQSHHLIHTYVTISLLQSGSISFKPLREVPVTRTGKYYYKLELADKVSVCTNALLYIAVQIPWKFLHMFLEHY